VPHRCFSAVKEVAKKLDMDNIENDSLFETSANKIDLIKLLGESPINLYHENDDFSLSKHE
jgi:hypothetical protein